MAQSIPDEELRISQLVVQQGWIRPEQARTALELYQRYRDKTTETPSLLRILVNKGYIGRKQGEQVLRHVLKGEPIPASATPAAGTPQISAFQTGKPAAEPGKPRPPAPSAFGKPAPSAPHRPGPPAPEVPAGLKTRAAAGGSSPSLPLPATRSPNVSPHEAGAAQVRQHSEPEEVPVADTRDGSEDADNDANNEMLEGLGALVLSKELQEIKGYKIESVVGEGAMGIVYKAQQLSMDRPVALKVLPPHRTKDARFVDEFLEEARNAGRLNHPNLIRVHEVGRSGSLFFYSMEYIDGQRLDELMDECVDGRLEMKQALQIFLQVASALDSGFRANIIHREIRPNSVMLTADGMAKLADLGLVKDEQARFLTGENAYYVSPEQAAGKEADTRSDIYSLGCCLFQALTGERPFDDGGTPRDVMMRRVNNPVPSPYAFNPRLPQELSRLVMKMMQRDPALRYQTPAEVVDALKKVSLSPTPRTTTTRTKLTATRRKFRR